MILHGNWGIKPSISCGTSVFSNIVMFRSYVKLLEGNNVNPINQPQATIISIINIIKTITLW